MPRQRASYSTPRGHRDDTNRGPTRCSTLGTTTSPTAAGTRRTIRCRNDARHQHTQLPGHSDPAQTSPNPRGPTGTHLRRAVAATHQTGPPSDPNTSRMERSRPCGPCRTYTRKNPNNRPGTNNVPCPTSAVVDPLRIPTPPDTSDSTSTGLVRTFPPHPRVTTSRTATPTAIPLPIHWPSDIHPPRHDTPRHATHTDGHPYGTLPAPPRECNSTEPTPHSPNHQVHEGSITTRPHTRALHLTQVTNLLPSQQNIAPYRAR